MISVYEDDLDLECELTELLQCFTEDFDKNADPDGLCHRMAVRYLNAAGIDEWNIDGVEYFLNSALDLEQKYLKELEFVNPNDKERIDYLKDKLEKSRAMSIGLMSIVLNYKNESKFLM